MSEPKGSVPSLFGIEGRVSGRRFAWPQAEERETLARVAAYEVASVRLAGRFASAVDVSAGSGAQVRALQARPGLNIHLFDQDDHRSADVRVLCEASAISFGRLWYPDYDGVAALLDLKGIGSPLVVVAADLLHRIEDSRPLLRALRQLLKGDRANRLIASVPIAREADGEPAPDEYRRWSEAEFIALLAATGLKIEQRLARSDPEDGGTVLVVEASYSEEGHAALLRARGLTQELRHLILLSDRSGTNPAGGVARYAAELAGVADGIAVLTAGESGALRDTASGEGNPGVQEWLPPSDKREQEAIEDLVLEACLNIVSLCDDLLGIEYDARSGIGLRLAQAKRCGLLPAALRLTALCFDTMLSCEATAEVLLNANANLAVTKEKLSIELADAVLFPSEPARQLYMRDYGVVPRGEIVVAPPPFRFGHALGIDNERKGEEIGTLLVLPGAQGLSQALRSALVGFLENHRTSAKFGLRCIIAYPAAASVPDADLVQALGAEMVPYATADEFRALLHRLRRDAIAAVPRPWLDSFPLLFAIEAGCPVLAIGLDGLGIELREEDRRFWTCADEAGFPAVAGRLLEASPAERRRVVREVRAKAELAGGIQAQKHRQRLQDSARPLPSPTVEEVRSRVPEVAVVVPVYNRPKQELIDLVTALNRSFLKPAELVVVDDCSRESVEALVGEELARLAIFPLRFLRNERNLGLAGARNAGLAAVTAEYIATHDSDDLALPDFLLRAVLTLERLQELDGVGAWLESFEDGDDWSLNTPPRQLWRPIGDGVIACSGENHLSTAMSVFRTARLRALGGWDAEDKSMWEDWGLYLRIVNAGGRLMVIPKACILYRLRADSMLRTAPVFPARRRLARSYVGLSRFEGFALQRLAAEHGRTSELAQVRTLAATQAQRIAALEEVAAEKDRRIAELETILQQYREQIGELEHGGEEQAKLVRAAEQRNTELTAQIAELNRTSEKMKEALVSAQLALDQVPWGLVRTYQLIRPPPRK